MYVSRIVRNNFVNNLLHPTGSKKIEQDRNWGIGKDRTFLSHPTHHFASPKLYLLISPHLPGVLVEICRFYS